MKTYRRLLALVPVALLLSACSIEETSAPPLAGPSEFALGIVVHAAPDSILQDGVSQSFITIEANGPDGRPARNVPLRLAIQIEGSPQDFGTLSTKSTSTDDNGRARVTYTAPPKPAESTGSGTVVTIVVTPIGNDYRGERDRVVDIRVVPPGVIVPPNSIAPAFTFSPTTATAFSAVTFDASTTASDGVACGTRCSYTWTFGDGGTGNGMIVLHEFRSVGTFPVQLTVRNERGQSASTQQSVTVGGGQAPTASFAFSPTAPLPGQAIFFNASASTPAAGRSIVRYDWDFGSGRTGEGVTVSKTYDTAGSYVVTLKVTDDASQVATTTQTVTVGGGTSTLPTADFVFSPENPTPGQMIFFNASASTAGPGRRIVSYRWDFGSGRTGEGVTISKGYDTAGSYVVTLTVVDDQGQQGIMSKTVAVATTPPTAIFTSSPNNAKAPVTINFNATASRAGPGRQIASYSWDFGDGQQGTGATVSHLYSNPGTYVVVLTVRDDAGLATTVSQSVTVAVP
jgi:PKD repeat protein